MIETRLNILRSIVLIIMPAIEKVGLKKLLILNMYFGTGLLDNLYVGHKFYDYIRTDFNYANLMSEVDTDKSESLARDYVEVIARDYSEYLKDPSWKIPNEVSSYARAIEIFGEDIDEITEEFYGRE